MKPLSRSVRPFSDAVGRRCATARVALPTQTLSNFSIDFTTAPLGVGACGTVYSGWHSESARDVAVKVMSPMSMGSEGTSASSSGRCRADRERTAVEQVLHQGISHPRVVDFMGYFEGSSAEASRNGLVSPEDNAGADINTVHYVVMERLSGQSLQERIKAVGNFDESHAKEVTRAVCEGLAFLHEKGIVHRDICPRNVLYAEPGADGDKVKIIDFSHAGVLPESASVDDQYFDERLGTAGFIAPEILNRKEPYGAKCDVYSLGCTVHAMMAAGRPPRRHPRLGIVTCLPETASEEASNFVKALLDPNPSHRPSAADALMHPWLDE